MALNFPDAPTVGQVFQAGSTAWMWDSVKWVAASAPATTGDAKFTVKTIADPGWVMANDGTIGSATSGATTRANADTQPLFALLWNNTANAQCPVLGGRGASAAADFAANKTIQLPLMLGRALAVAGAGAGLSSRVLAASFGEENHTLVTGEMPSHNHMLQYYNGAANSGGAGPWALADHTGTGLMGSGANYQFSTWILNTGNDGAHNNMQPSAFLNVMVKL